MKICFVTTKMPFFDVRVYYKEIRSLQKIYTDMVCICPATPDGYLEDMSFKSKEKLDQGDQKIIDGLKVKAVRSRRDVFKNYVLDKIYTKTKVLYELLFCPVPKAFYELALAEEADIYQAEELESYWICLRVQRTLAKRGKVVKIVFDCQEFWQASMYDVFMNFPLLRSLVRFITSRLEKRVADTADYIITCNNVERAGFLIFNRFAKTEVIYNATTSGSSVVPVEIPGISAEDLVLVHEGYLYF